MNTFAGVKKANNRRAICVDEYLEKYVELYYDMEQYASEGAEEARDMAGRMMAIEVTIDELSAQWHSLQYSYANIQKAEISAEEHAAFLLIVERAFHVVSTPVLETPLALVAQHSPPNLSRHLSSNAPPSLGLSTDLVSASALAYRKGNAHRT